MEKRLDCREMVAFGYLGRPVWSHVAILLNIHVASNGSVVKKKSFQKAQKT